MMIYVLIWSFILSKSMIFAPFPCRNVSKEFPIKDMILKEFPTVRYILFYYGENRYFVIVWAALSVLFVVFVIESLLDNNAGESPFSNLDFKFCTQF